ncbi:MAG: bacteriophage holin [Parachlamydiales bacterium]
MNKLNVKAFSLTCAITWSLALLVLAWISAFGWGIRDVSMLAGLYLGYKATFFGGIIGALWGFFDAGIGGFIFSSIYNYFLKKFSKIKAG